MTTSMESQPETPGTTKPRRRSATRARRPGSQKPARRKDPRGRKPLPVDPVKVAELFAAGKSYAQLAAQMGCSTRTICRALELNRQPARSIRSRSEFRPDARATLIVALKLYQSRFPDPQSAAAEFPHDFAAIMPLDTDQIDDLIEYLKKT